MSKALQNLMEYHAMADNSFADVLADIREQGLRPRESRETLREMFTAMCNKS